MGHVNRNSATRQPAHLSWQEALAIIERCDERGVPIPFAIAFCTCDESRKTGGEIIRYQKAVWHLKGGRVHKNDSFERVGGKPPKKDNPKTNWMRNIRGVDTNQPRQLHIHLILQINGHPVRRVR